VAPSNPGVYVEELDSGVHAIPGAETSITAFVGFAPRGPVDTPTAIRSVDEYTRAFGGLDRASTMSYAVAQFFQNGGTIAVVVRATGAGAQRSVGTQPAPPGLSLAAASPGEWGDKLLMRIDHDASDPVLFNLSVKDTGTRVVEVLRDLPTGPALGPALLAQSRLVRLDGHAPASVPAAHSAISAGDDPFDPAVPSRHSTFGGGADGARTETDIVPANDNGRGMYALARAGRFNLLVIPPVAPAADQDAARVLTPVARGRAVSFARDHRALFLVDPDPDWGAPSDIAPTGLPAYLSSMTTEVKRNAALYFPYLRVRDPLHDDAVMECPPTGAVAGVMARIDAQRGVWKAPAGVDAALAGVLELTAELTDNENAVLNRVGVNCLRAFADAGHVVWGTRTLAGDDDVADEWKYVSVRRTALFVEQSLDRGTQWAVFEPNDEPLWAQIRLAVGAFMRDLFGKGAFQGTTPQEAFVVKCDAETTTQDDIDNGVVNILVGFAPLMPAEFVMVRIQQLALQKRERLLGPKVSECVADPDPVALGDSPASALSIDLPDLDAEVDGDVVRDNLAAAQVIYLAAAMENALLFAVADKLVELFERGMLPVSTGGAGDALIRYGRKSPTRMSELERRSLYARVFGCPGGDATSVMPTREFAELWMRFVSAVASFNRQSTIDDVLRSTPVAISQQPAKKAGYDLVINLSQHASGIAHFAARELQSTITDIIGILSSEEVKAAYGARDLWQVVDRVATLELRRGSAARYRTMATTGAIIIRWLANNHERLRASARVSLLEPRALQPRGSSHKPIKDPTARELVEACEQQLVITGTVDA